MARLGRSYAKSKLGKPTALNPAVVFPPVKVKLAPAILARDHRPRSYRLGAPTVVGPAARFRAPLVSLSKPPRQTRHNIYALRPPTVVSIPVVYVAPPVKVVTTRRDQRFIHAQYRLAPPTVVFPYVAAPVEVKLTWQRKRPTTVSRLNPPTVVAPAVTFQPVRTKLTWQRKRPSTSYKLNPPTTLAAPPAFVPSPVKVTTTRVPSRFFKAKSQLGAPTVTNPSVRFRAPLVSLTRPPRQSRVVRSQLRPPTVTGSVVTTPPFPGVTPHLVPRQQPSSARNVTSWLFGPQVINPPPQFAGSLHSFAPQPSQARRTHSLLRRPAVTFTFTNAPIKVKLAPSSRLARGTHSRLRAPVLPNIVSITPTATIAGHTLFLASIQRDPLQLIPAGFFGSTSFDATISGLHPVPPPYPSLFVDRRGNGRERRDLWFKGFEK